MKTVAATVSAAAFMFAVHTHGEPMVAILMGGIFAFLSFHWCLRLEEDEQFSFAFVGFFFVFLIFVLIRFM